MKHVRTIAKAAAALAALLAGSPAIAGWEPTKPVEIVDSVVEPATTVAPETIRFSVKAKFAPPAN